MALTSLDTAQRAVAMDPNSSATTASGAGSGPGDADVISFATRGDLKPGAQNPDVRE